MILNIDKKKSASPFLVRKKMTRPAEAARSTQRKSPPFKEVFNYFDDNEDYDATNLKEVIIESSWE